MEQLAPDWWMRGVTRPGRRNAPLRDLSGNAAKGGGARNRAERRAEPRATKGADEEGSGGRLVPVGFLVPFDPASLLFLLSLWILARALESLERARSRCSSERGAVVRASAEIAPENPVRSPKPRPCCRADHTCGARHELADHAGGARSCGHGRRTRRSGRSRLLFSLGFV